MIVQEKTAEISFSCRGCPRTLREKAKPPMSDKDIDGILNRAGWRRAEDIGFFCSNCLSKATIAFNGELRLGAFPGSDMAGKIESTRTQRP